MTVNVGKARELYEKYWEQLKAGGLIAAGLMKIALGGLFLEGSVMVCGCFHLHSAVKIQPFSPVFLLAEYRAKAFCRLSLWNFKEKASTIFYNTAFSYIMSIISIRSLCGLVAQWSIFGAFTIT